MGIRSVVRRQRGLSALTALVVAGVISLGLYWFAPWNLFVDKHVDEALPTVAASPVATETAAVSPSLQPSGPQPSPSSPGPAPTSGAGAPSPSPRTAGPVVLARGDFRSLEHSTSGRALLLQLSDGSRYLRLEDLNTSNGPDLRVWLTDQPVSSDWHVWDDGRYVDLGALKGNVGDQNYLLPSSVDVTKFRTAVVWCRRFQVGFGVAPLESA
jgi:Electron transfer DM13